MLMKRIILSFAILLGISDILPAQSLRTIHLVTTGDVHGSWFREPYVDGQRTRTSLMSVKHYVDSLRLAAGPDNVLLLDAGDALQGDNAAYYFNYVVPEKPHLFTLISKYMGYDVMVMGNHDIETGHAVYDRVNFELGIAGIPWLGGNTVWAKSGKPYFPVYTIVKKAGLKVAVLGFNNSYIRNWVSEDLWKGMDFKDLLPYVQECVNQINDTEKPDITVVAVHSGTGEGNGTQLENQALDLFNSLEGVDVLVGAHDHANHVSNKDGKCYVNGGARAGYVGHCTIDVQLDRRNRIEGKHAEAEVVRMNKDLVDETMVDLFRNDFEEVKAFTNRKVGSLEVPLYTRDAYKGMCDYVNLVHTVQLTASESQISFAAPLSFNGTVRQGDVVFNDMFTIYPYENQMVVARLRGSEIKNYLEYSYDSWICTPGEHVLRIHEETDRNGRLRWAFDGRSYNFDSAAGLVYTVDVTKPCGSRVVIVSLAGGSAFDPEAWYNVAMTSYRANGGGGLIREGAGISAEEMNERIIAKYPEIRNLIYDFISGHGSVTKADISNPAVLGSWSFVPERTVAPLMEADMAKLFRK